MRIRSDRSYRSVCAIRRPILGVTLVTLLNLSLGACSPVVLQEDTDTEGTGADTGSEGSGGMSSGVTEGEGGGDSVPAACVDLQPRVLGILENNCAKCHGAGSAGQGGIGYILNLEELITQRKVAPGDAEGSRIYARMTDPKSPMPPLPEMVRPSDTDTEIIGKWINECAGLQSCGDQPFYDTTKMLEMINQDLSKVDFQSKKTTRYLTFVHLYNAGWCDAEIELFRQALSKLVNSLSHGPLVTAPLAIDPERLIFRIDLTDYKWEARADLKPFKLSEPSFHFRDADPLNDSPGSANADAAEQAELAKEYRDIWEMMADQNPYTIEYLGEIAANLKTDSDTLFPIIQGDAFIDASSRSPLYYDILGIPRRSAQLNKNDPPCGDKGTADECLETQLGVSILAEIDAEFALDKDFTGRAGFKKSDVSRFNRIVERHLINGDSNRAFWISYDFAGQADEQNIFVNPLDFDFDGGEIIFSLENGLQGYMLTDKLGTRLNEGPQAIVQDPSQEDNAVRNGVSCIGCHGSGMIKVNDEIRESLVGSNLFDQATKDKINDLYPPRDAFTALQDEDVTRFNNSMAKAGVVASDQEPVVTSFLSFDEDMGLRRVGAEYGLTSDQMVAAIGKLGNDLNDLTQEGNTIQRADFSKNFDEGACILLLGCTRACPGPDPASGVPIVERTCAGFDNP